MRTPRILFLFFSLCIIGLCHSTAWAQKENVPQKSWKELVKDAEGFEQKGDYERAALYYESAYVKKSDDKSLTYRAGNCYFLVRDYAETVKCLEPVKNENANKAYDKPGYKYALSLKQIGEYDKAKAAFTVFLSGYSGDDKKQLSDRINIEIQGCNFAVEAKNNEGGTGIKHLGPGVNTDAMDFAPVPFGSDELYFSSTKGGVAKVYHSKKEEGKGFMNRQEFEASSKIKTNFCNGSITPDGKRFYFTQCKLENTGTLCAIYVVVFDNGRWSEPEKLPDYINEAGFTATHPSVSIDDDQEIIYFASNRPGGKGGLDIWYTTRPIGNRGNQNYTLPKNLGHNINTVDDEITPFYHSDSKTLYFSSNGRISAGGLDIFKSSGARSKWELPINMGFPTNSPADDFGYVLSEAHGGGYLVSNRILDPIKVTTNNDDIFFFGQEALQLIVKGNIYDAKDPNKLPLRDINAKLFSIENGAEELVMDKMLSVGEYRFVLGPNKDYLIELSCKGFQTASFKLKTHGITRSETRVNDIAMEVPKVTPPPVTEPDPIFVIVPPEYDSPKNPYTLPKTVPNNPKTGKPFAKGTPAYEAYIEADEVAIKATNRQVYWDHDNLELLPLIKEVVVAKVDTPKKSDVTNPNTEMYKPYKETPKVAEGKSFKIQVAAVRSYKEYKYEDLTKGLMDKYKLVFEPMEGNLTRIIIVPIKKNEDGTEGFKTKSDALTVLSYIMDHTRFKTAFAIAYEGDERIGEGFRGLDEEGQPN